MLPHATRAPWVSAGQQRPPGRQGPGGWALRTQAPGNGPACLLPQALHSARVRVRPVCTSCPQESDQNEGDASCPGEYTSDA